MKNQVDSLYDLIAGIPEDLQIQTKLSVAIAARIESLMSQEGLSKKKFADALGRRPSEVTKWLSGEHNFTIATLSRLSAYFGKSIIEVPDL